MSYWLQIPPITGKLEGLSDGEILIIGSGLSGVSLAYWLLNAGFKDITIVDYDMESSASFRNCGHILHGSVESMQALVALHGRSKAKAIWDFSIHSCQLIQDSIRELDLDCEYRKDGYLVMAIDDQELSEIHRSIELMQSMNFPTQFVDALQLQKLGFKEVYGARFDPDSACAHPVKFRNGLLRYALDRGVKYVSGLRIEDIEEIGDKACIKAKDTSYSYELAILATNAYSPLIHRHYAQQRLVEPFRGQILTSYPLNHRFSVTYPHSFDHGYEYALVTQDNCLMIGGWRNHVSGGELGTYDLHVNPEVERGLKHFVQKHYDISEAVEWEYSWSGIMAASKTGFPFIGPLSPRVMTCAGYTGHGLSWAHGSAQLLVKMICGQDYDKSLAQNFNPRTI